jgi:hypothetical protein
MQLEKVMPDITETNKRIKARDAAIGFLGWIIFHNLSIFFYFSDLFYPVMIYSAAVITPLVFYSKKRVWISAGIIFAFTINSGLWIHELVSSNLEYMWSGGFGWYCHIHWEVCFSGRNNRPLAANASRWATFHVT